MKKSELALLYNYIYNGRQRLDDEVRQLQSNIRFKPVDIVDCSEMSNAIVRRDTFYQITRDIMQLLSLEVLEPLESNELE